MTDFHLETAWLPDGWASDVHLRVDGAGVIRAIEPDGETEGAERISGAVLPGIPNLHSHAFQRAAAGLTERRHAASGDSFWTWREVMHGFVTRLSPDDVEAIALQLYIEMLKAGYTSVGEFHYLHHGPGGVPYEDRATMSWRIAAAAESAGIGLTLLPVLYTRGGYNDIQPNDGQLRFLMQADDFLGLIETLTKAFSADPSVCVGIAPHSVRQVDANALAGVLRGFEALSPGGPVHIHSAEQVKDVDEHVKETGLRPVRWLLENAEVGPNWCLVHATHLDADETADLAAGGAVAGLCPTTEANLGDGIFPLVDFLSAGGAIGIGSDSHISVSAVEELRWLEYGQRLIHLSRNVAAEEQGGSTGVRLLKAVLGGGAQALGQPTGALAAGCRADLVVLDPENPWLMGRDGDTLIDSMIFAGNQNPVRHVMSGGRWVVRDGRHGLEEETAEAYRRTLARLA